MRSTILASVMLLLTAATPAHAAPGALDPTFSGDGWTWFRFGDQEAYGGGIAGTPDGRVVVVGSSGPAGARRFAVARLNGDGTLDTTFGGDGRVTTAIGTTASAADAVVQPDGKIVVVGRTQGADGHNKMAVARYLPGGQLDPTFSDDGRLVLRFNVWSAGYGVALSGAKIVVVGGSGKIVRLTPTGELDPTFSGDGRVQPGGVGAWTDVRVVDGRILVAGYVGEVSRIRLDRYTSAGSLDTSFGDGDGKVVTAMARSSLATGLDVDNDARIVVVATVSGSNHRQVGVARYTPTGALDTSFSGDGTSVLRTGSDDQATSVAVQGDDRILIGAVQAVQQSVIRLNAGGGPDTTFGEGGARVMDFKGDATADVLADLTLQGGRLVTVGYAPAQDGSPSLTVTRMLRD